MEPRRRRLLLAGLGLAAVPAGPALAQSRALKLYAPGGVEALMKDCGTLFERETGVKVEVITEVESKWIDQARQEGDLFLGGTEAIMSDFIARHPDLAEASTRTSLYVRGAGIVVRKGNPKQIRSVADLARPGMRLINVNGQGLFGLMEDSAGHTGHLAAIQANRVLTVAGGAFAKAKWQAMPELDAWVTLEPWHRAMADMADFVPMSEPGHIHRGASIVTFRRSTLQQDAAAFTRLLKTERAHALFRQHGWR